MDLGFTLTGAFVGSDSITRDGSITPVVLLAVGMNAYRVYMDGLLGKPLEMGQIVTVSCRPYVTKAGALGFGNGKLIG